MIRLLIAVLIVLAFEFGTASRAAAQIVYGYSTIEKKTQKESKKNNGEMDTQMITRPTYYPYWSYQAPSSSNYSSGGGSYSPATVYLQSYPPIGPNYRLSPVGNYGTMPYGMGSAMGYGMNPGFRPMYGMSPMYGGFRPMGYGGFGSMLMRR